jgi:hypothetical protein
MNSTVDDTVDGTPGPSAASSETGSRFCVAPAILPASDVL